MEAAFSMSVAQKDKRAKPSPQARRQLDPSPHDRGVQGALGPSLTSLDSQRDLRLIYNRLQPETQPKTDPLDALFGKAMAITREEFVKLVPGLEYCPPPIQEGEPEFWDEVDETKSQLHIQSAEMLREDGPISTKALNGVFDALSGGAETLDKVTVQKRLAQWGAKGSDQFAERIESALASMNTTSPILISGQNVYVTPAMRKYVDTKIGNVMERFHSWIMQVSVKLYEESRALEGSRKVPDRFVCEVIVYPKGSHSIEVRAKGESMYAAIDVAETQINRQLSKHKEKRLRDRLKSGSILVGETPGSPTAVENKDPEKIVEESVMEDLAMNEVYDEGIPPPGPVDVAEEADGGIRVERGIPLAEAESMGMTSWPTWSCDASTFPWKYDQEETCYILEGEVEVVPMTPTGEGRPVKITAGDIAIFPKGLGCTWKVTKAVRKHYQFK